MAKLQEKRKKVKKLILTLLLEPLLRNILILRKMVGIDIFQKLFFLYTLEFCADFKYLGLLFDLLQ